MGINRRRLLLSGIGATAVITLGTVTALATRTPTRTTIDSLEYPVYAVHRLGGGLYPENTITGAKAITKDFPDAMLEFDVQALKDGTLVVIHDEEVDRVAANGAKGRVDNMTVNQWRKLRIKHPKGEASAPASFLTDVLDEFPDTPMLVELKAKHRRDAFVELMWDRRDRTILGSFDDALTSIYTRSGFYALQQVQGTSYPDIIDGVHAVGMDRGRLTPDVIDRIHDAGAKVWAWGDDLRRKDPRFIDMGLDGYMVNDPTK